MLHLICITLDRAWAVSAPFHHMVNANKKNFVIPIVFFWIFPIFIAAAFAVIILLKKIPLQDKLVYFERTNGSSVGAKVILGADIIFIVSYSVIIGIVIRNKSSAKQHRSRQQEQSMKTLVLCFSIVLVFIFAKTPFVVVYLVPWNPPDWLYKVATVMFPLDHILNSIIYLIQKYRQKTTSRNSLIVMSNVRVYNNNHVLDGER